MYGSVSLAPQFAQPTNNANSNANVEEQFLNVETEVNDVDPQELHVLHDPDNPKIAEGELFPDIKSFRNP
jgi:hypothetical protein